jgi:hypothetical protein
MESALLIEAVMAVNEDVVVDSCAAGSGDDEIIFGLPGIVDLTTNGASFFGGPGEEGISPEVV